MRTQGEDVAGLDDVFGFGGRGDGGLDGQGAVGGGNAGGDALRRFDGNSKVGTVLRAVFLGHHGQAEPLDHAAFHRQANQSARVFDHEVDGFGGDELRRHQQIAFVFAVFRVGDDDHFAGFDVGKDFGDGGNVGHGASFLMVGLGCGVFLIQPHGGHLRRLFDFAGLFLAEGFVFQKGGQFTLVDGDGFGKTGLLAAVFVRYPLPQVAAAQVGGVHDVWCG